MNGRIIGEFGDEDALSGLERAHLDKIRAIEEFGAARRIYISHGAGGDWFVVEPQVGLLDSTYGTPIDTDLAAARLMDAGRTVYTLEPKLWRNKGERKRTERVDLALRPLVYILAGFFMGVVIRTIT